jgi:hypothetical protein
MYPQIIVDDENVVRIKFGIVVEDWWNSRFKSMEVIKNVYNENIWWRRRYVW